MKPWHLAFVLLINLLWGGNFVAAKVGVEHFPPMLFTGLRFVIVGLLLAPFLRIVPGQMPRVLAISLLAGALHFALMFTGVKLADDVTTIAVVTQLGIPIATLMAVVLLRERIRWRRTLGIALAFGGVVLMSFDPRVFGYIGAVLVIAVSTAFMALAQILMRQLRGVEVFNLQAWIALPSAPVLLLMSLAFERGQVPAVATAGWFEWSMVGYSAIAASVIGHSGMYYLLKRYPVTLVTPTFTLAPVFGIVGGITLLSDQVTTKMLLGGAVTLIGVLIITLREPRVAAERVD